MRLLPLILLGVLTISLYCVISPSYPKLNCDVSSPVINIAPIASLNDGVQIHGSFLIGSGHIKQKPAYTFYVGNDSIGYQLRTIEADGVKIFTDENDHPYYLTKIIWIDGGVSCFPIFIQELHVPNTTIIKQYTLDGAL